MSDLGSGRPDDARHLVVAERLRGIHARTDVLVEARRGVSPSQIAKALNVTERDVLRVLGAPPDEAAELEDCLERLVLDTALNGSPRESLVESLSGLEWSPAIDLVIADLSEEGWLHKHELDRVRHAWVVSRRARRHGWSTASSTSAQMRRALAADDELWLMQLVRAARRDVALMIACELDLLPSWYAAPQPIDSPWDALLAALVGHEFSQARLSPPIWTSTRVLDEEWIPDQGLPREHVLADTPAWLIGRHILLRSEHLDDPD